MNRAPDSHWASIGEAGFIGGIRLLVGIYKLFGRWPFRLVLYPILSWYVLSHRVARAASRDYLARLHAFSGGVTPAPNLASVLRHFASFAETVLDKLLVWRGDLDDTEIRRDGGEILQSVIDAGRGGVLMTAHIGNFEMLRKLGETRRNIRLNILVHTKHAERFNRLLRETHPEAHIRLIQVSEVSAATAVLLSERVEAGEFVVIAGDRVPVSQRPDTVDVPFLGAPAPLPIGPYVLAAVLKCPLIALVSSRRRDHFHITVRLLAERVVLPRADRRGAIAALAAGYAALLEAECRVAPLQWFNFYPFWSER
ncbi:acyltransferase [Jeongeupia naejangsanensis]|uniref:Acyltransferase n=1 Tax=Jeongeupia naejangsanensis TaxID=613195 RepID=A0ABS2BNC8_9NEIS|nr:acyltransferase [Jeongeupia naejangsanensis]MBM3117132.1 acyltransferase [Jeongeupia naejangsanensis]